ncbi:hypothetical protein [Planctomicrobium piriforme]|uniref:Uncharacterized protein n=1 Tax=Planctomicrobium piriforme TaxID=1576369 RepID=A0A1I3BC65_9PLAN|nr:hypothetical protein [Planctomicrobium piriforme]SFH59878.1 hypothetical protein SAMN05421753_101371 [Planctomicrobium piriforme]
MRRQTLLHALCLSCLFLEATIGRAEEIVTVRAEDIGTSVQIIGRLGKPLETMMTIEGRWRYPTEVTKDGLPYFEVTHIDNQRLQKPLSFVHGSVVQVEWDTAKKRKPADMEIWKFRAFESARFPYGTSTHWADFYGVPVSSANEGDSPFASQLVVAMRTLSSELRQTDAIPAHPKK